ncbi:AAA family ATPase [Nocardia sp. 2YAB30]|uniref:AAA family ATPase n=1 Tax=unclassified Nocardia TaxID=2637762 RepID=UPI003F947DD0
MAIRSQDRVGGLPTATANIVGREPELEKISTLLVGSARLITLTGPGGIGKTRLAVEVARRFHKATNVPVYWVRLERLAKGSDTAAVEEEIARSVVDTDFSMRSAWESLIDTFTRTDAVRRRPQCVLVLDNCEHVLVGVGELITELLDAVPGLTIVATSREPIGWVDEHLVAVPPLSRQHAVTLFRQRAELTGHPITEPEQIATAVKICRHVHNHPLYIRLSAARLAHQPPAMILRGLTGGADDTRLHWSPGPRSEAGPRHHGVRDVIAWSYELCSDKERLLFDRLSVFAAGNDTNPEDSHGAGDAAGDMGTDLDAIETICSDDTSETDRNSHAGADLPRQEIEGLLERLVNHSLVTVHITPTTVRYSLLESLRVFAQQRLRERSVDEVDEPARLAWRHRRYYRDKVVFASASWFGPAEQDLLDWARAEWDNILTAIETSITTPGEAAVGLEICTGLFALRMPFYTGAFRELRQWTGRCLQATQASTSQPTELQMVAMALIAGIAVHKGEHEDAERMLEDCIAACIPDPDSRRDWRHTPETDIGLPASAELAWGMELIFARRDVRAIGVLARAREKFHHLGDHGAEAVSDLWAGFAAGLLGTARQAHEIARRSLDRANASGASLLISWAELTWAITLTEHGNPTEALDVERRALAYLLSLRDRWGASWAVQFRTWSLAQIIADSVATGKLDRDTLVALATEIAQLTGGTKTQLARLGVDLEKLGPLADESTKAVAIARQVLGPEAFTAEEARGARLRPEHDEVERLALGTLSIGKTPENQTSREDLTAHWQLLTPTEQQVAILAAAGWTNTAIAARRGNSVRTIDAQLTAILNKLIITTRNDIIEHVPRNVIDTVRIEATHLSH